MEINEQIIRVRIGNWWSPDRYYVRVWIDTKEAFHSKRELCILIKAVCSIFTRPSPKWVSEFLITNEVAVNAVEIVDKDGYGKLHYPDWP